MTWTRLAVLLAVPALALGACGKGKQVNTATYTCGQFNKSLRTKGDNTSGNFINRLRDQAKLGQSEKKERNEITLGIVLACRDKPASTHPAQEAIKVARLVKAGKFRLATPAPAKKRPKK